MNRKKLGLTALIVSFLILLISSFPITPFHLVKHLERKFPSYSVADAPRADAIIILGGALALPQYPRSDIELVGSSDRIRYAALLYKANKTQKLVIAGGNVFPQSEIRGEAYYIAQLLVEWGVNESDILFEEKSRNTFENALYIKPILKENRLSNILLVTSATHMPRAFAVFKAQGIDVIAAPTDFLAADTNKPGILDWLPTAEALASTSWILKEYMGWWYYKLRGYL